MLISKNPKRYLFMFFHVEKCGGTSLLSSSRRRKGLKHCDIISSKKLGNVASVRDFRRSLAMYTDCDFITGHCLYPGHIDEYKNIASSKGYWPITITSIRDPVERLLSDYAHARRMGEIIGLDQFIEIPFKKNYLCNFWGRGDIGSAQRRLNGIDYVVNIRDFGRFVYYVNVNYGLQLLPASHRNSSSTEQLPKDLVVEGGVRMGKYSIDEDIHNKIYEYNESDQILLRRIKCWVPDEGVLEGSSREVGAGNTKQVWGWLYRNLWYKPRMQRAFGYLYEKRNSAPHQLDEDVDYMWGD